MAQISFDGRFLSGDARLDQGIDGLSLAETDAGALLFSSSGPRGGIAVYDIGTGTVSLADSAHFDIGWSGDALAAPTPISVGGDPLLAVAAGGEAGLWAFAPQGDGALGPAFEVSSLPSDLGTVRALATGPSGNAYVADGLTGTFGIYAWTGSSYQGIATVADTGTTYAADVFDLVSVPSGGHHYVLAASESEMGVTAFRETQGALQVTGSLGAAEGLGVMRPTAMEVAQVGDRAFVVLGSAPDAGASAAISVMELRASGALLPADHVNDTLATRFGTLQALDIASLGGRTYVIAGGGDEGLTLFALLPDGRLHLLDVFVAGGAASLTNVTALQMRTDGEALRIFATSEGEAGIAAFRVSLDGQGATIQAGESGATAQGTAGNDLILGSFGDDAIDGGNGADILRDGAGTDTLRGGPGADRFVLDGDGAVDLIDDFDPLLDRLDLSGWAMLYDPTQLAITPTAQGAEIAWQNEILFLERDGGGTLTEAEVMAAIVEAPHRQPFLSIAGGPGDVLRAGASGSTLNGGPGMDTLIGGEGADLLDGMGSEDDVRGGNGDDVLTGGPGADRLDGGEGTDTAAYAQSGSGVTVRLWAGDGHGGTAEGDILIAVENLLGSDHADTLVGDVRNNLLSGGAGDDALWGNAGDDTLIGGEGADLLQGQGGTDTASYAGSSEGVTVRLWAGDGTGGDAQDDILVGVESLVGSEHGDTLVGDAGGNRLSGGDGDDALWGNAGDDWLQGGAGADLIQGQAGLDWAAYTASDAAVTVRLWAGDGRGGTAEGDVLAGIENLSGSDHDDTLVGDAQTNRLDGRAGADALWGNSGDDHLHGGPGNDLLMGQDGFDWALYDGSDTGVTVRLWAGDGVGGDAEGDLLVGIENLGGSAHDDLLVGDGAANHIRGGAGSDDLWANDGDDTLEGGAGADILRGQAGNDWASYAGSSEGVTVRLWAGDGQGGDAAGDLLIGIENLEGSGFDDVLAGDGTANVLSGLGGNDRLWAGAGDDTLEGGDGNDLLRGQAGDDLLIGGAGEDVFAFADGDGLDRIADFLDGDRIDLSDSALISNFSDLQAAATDTPDGVRIDLGGGAIVIESYSLANLDLTDFLFS